MSISTRNRRIRFRTRLRYPGSDVVTSQTTTMNAMMKPIPKTYAMIANHFTEIRYSEDDLARPREIRAAARSQAAKTTGNPTRMVPFAS
jgi:hypothetical protein